MKKITIIIAFALAAMLCGCEAKSVGIIGGADGPTAVFIENKNEKIKFEKKPVKILRIDGKLYYETGITCQTDGRCGNMDGKFKKSANEFEIPQNDNESNFSEADSYQTGEKKNTVEILIGDSYIRFDLIDTNSDILNYKYCAVLKGRLPNAESDSKYLVLSNEKNIDFKDASYKIFGADLSKMKNIYVLPLE